MKKLKWYSWLGLVVALLLIVLLVQHSIATFLEGEPQAFGPVLLILGLPALLIIALSLIPLWRTRQL
jgi:hypothetical protein